LGGEVKKKKKSLLRYFTQFKQLGCFS
jgi:hypothetical protein